MFGYDNMGPHKIWNKLQVCGKQLSATFHKPADSGE
jgi:hypothetical protein